MVGLNKPVFPVCITVGWTRHQPAIKRQVLCMNLNVEIEPVVSG
jgi:hypothetical protein